MDFSQDDWNMNLNNYSYANLSPLELPIGGNQLNSFVHYSNSLFNRQSNLMRNTVPYNAVSALQPVTLPDNFYDNSYGNGLNIPPNRYELQEIGNKNQDLSRHNEQFSMQFSRNMLGNSPTIQVETTSDNSSQILDLSKYRNSTVVSENSQIVTNEEQNNLVRQPSISEENHDISTKGNIQTTNLPSGSSDVNMNLGDPKIKKKRQKNKLDKAEEESSKVKQLCERHPVLEACKNCRMKCNEHISHATREKFNNAFWKLETFERRLFITNHVEVSNIKRRYENATRQRQHHYSYYVEDDEGNKRQVCKLFFTSMLGFKEGNDKMIKTALSSVDPVTLIPSAVENRGQAKNASAEKIRNLIEAHVESYHPCVSHYRRAHAPNRRYLSSEITITSMHNDFLDNHPQHKISYESYRSVVAKMNISFTKLGHEECEECEIFRLHNPNHGKENLNPDCEECNKWSIHNKKAMLARQKYQNHVENAFSSSKKEYFSVDLQKVIMLPKMEEHKVALFTRRLVAFNQSFVPLGSQQNMRKPMAVIWHEAVSGRKKEDIISAFHSFFLQNRDKKHLILWLDNCSAQNKNWCLLSFLIYLVNSEEIEAETIEFNYFESGHTFMSADAFHHQVESSMKKKGKIYDFADFQEAVGNANSGNVIVKTMAPTDFSFWIDYTSAQKLKKQVNRPYLHDIKQIKFHRGNHKMIYNLSYEENSESLEFDFLQTKVLKSGFPSTNVKSDFRGIPEAKKNDIVAKLLPLMPPNRRFFWRRLKVSNVSDLTTSYDDD